MTAVRPLSAKDRRAKGRRLLTDLSCSIRPSRQLAPMRQQIAVTVVFRPSGLGSSMLLF
ncbi:hypothetical protein [Gluconacetobacter tumulisoli]|uniref:Uncharacterized protein n=1 Tax=Gluconacetobacter tumulisoli TaxID=1286189 RepID=A0A7W4K4K5_9PROT|nr:hypothetical protein [Gluconacetobacter tumulisoli]MBB2200284.1 hypothetical protein [Gluconacetobacter tumulisoli]